MKATSEEAKRMAACSEKFLGMGGGGWGLVRSTLQVGVCQRVLPLMALELAGRPAEPALDSISTIWSTGHGQWGKGRKMNFQRMLVSVLLTFLTSWDSLVTTLDIPENNLQEQRVPWILLEVQFGMSECQPLGNTSQGELRQEMEHVC